MIYKIENEQHFQVLSSSFSVSPSESGYVLMFSANGFDFSEFTTVAAGQNKQFVNMSNGNYYYLSGNTDTVEVNWERECHGGGGGGTAGVSSLDGQTGALTTKTINGNAILGSGNIEISGGDSAATIVSAVTEANAYTDSAITAQQFKTINGSGITGSGNLVIEGGSGDYVVVDALSAITAPYEGMVAFVPASGINLDDFVVPSVTYSGVSITGWSYGTPTWTIMQGESTDNVLWVYSEDGGAINISLFINGQIVQDRVDSPNSWYYWENVYNTFGYTIYVYFDSNTGEIKIGFDDAYKAIFDNYTFTYDTGISASATTITIYGDLSQYSYTFDYNYNDANDGDVIVQFGNETFYTYPSDTENTLVVVDGDNQQTGGTRSHGLGIAGAKLAVDTNTGDVEMFIDNQTSLPVANTGLVTSAKVYLNQEDRYDKIYRYENGNWERMDTIITVGENGFIFSVMKDLNNGRYRSLVYVLYGLSMALNDSIYDGTSYQLYGATYDNYYSDGITIVSSSLYPDGVVESNWNSGYGTAHSDAFMIRITDLTGGTPAWWYQGNISDNLKNLKDRNDGHHVSNVYLYYDSETEYKPYAVADFFEFNGDNEQAMWTFIFNDFYINGTSYRVVYNWDENTDTWTVTYWDTFANYIHSL